MDVCAVCGVCLCVWNVRKMHGCGNRGVTALFIFRALWLYGGIKSVDSYSIRLNPNYGWYNECVELSAAHSQTDIRARRAREWEGDTYNPAVVVPLHWAWAPPKMWTHKLTESNVGTRRKKKFAITSINSKRLAVCLHQQKKGNEAAIRRRIMLVTHIVNMANRYKAMLVR